MALTFQEDVSEPTQGEVGAGPTQVSRIFDQHLYQPSAIREQEYSGSIQNT